MILSSRRRFLATTAALTGTLLLPGQGSAQNPSRTRLILLGTGGGPRPRKASSAASQVILIDNVAYVIDCGDGVAAACLRERPAGQSEQHLSYASALRP
jgi:hypothetical protein